MNTANGVYSSHQSPLNSALDQNGAHAPFGHNVNPNSFDFSQQFPNQPGQRFADGIPNNNSPSVHQSPFQVPSVVPQKRARDDQITASPHLSQNNNLGHSRSQTPQQAAFNQYGGQGPTHNFSTPTPFQQHMQASNHATPSPNPSNQQFRPPTSQPSMSSPQHFPGQNPQAPSFPHMQNPMNRMGTPQNPQNHFMPGMQPGQAMHPGAHGGMHPGGPQMGGQMPGMRPMPGQPPNQQQQDMYKQYQQSLMMRQQQMRMNQMGQPGQPNGMSPQQRAAIAGGMAQNMPGKPNMPGMPMGADRSNPQNQMAQFMSQLQTFMHARGQQLDPQPTICGRQVHYFQIFQLFFRFRPHVNPGGWQPIFQAMHIPPNQQQQAATELRSVYERNLKEFSVNYMQMMERQKMQAQGRMPGQGSPTGDRPGLPPGYPGQTAQQQPQPGPSPAMKDRARAASSAAPEGIDRGTPGKPPSVTGQSGSPQQFPQGSPVPLKLQGQDSTEVKPKPDSLDQVNGLSRAEEPRDLFDPEYKPRRYSQGNFGSLPPDVVGELGALVYDFKTFQRWEEVGPVDLLQLTLGLQSGFQAEINYSLERLAALAMKPLYLPLCLDMTDVLLDLGREAISRLSEDVELTSDLEFAPVEELATSSRDENYEFKADFEFGTPDYEKRHAVDRLIAITTIFRNLSFPFPDRPDVDAKGANEGNKEILTSTDMQSFLTRVIQLISANNPSLKLNKDRLDLAKDVVTLLSNVSASLVISSEEDAKALLTFLLSFAPKSMTVSGGTEFTFAPYEPLRHQWLPNAVDSLAKILARDDPNRGLIKSILHGNLASVNEQLSDSLITKAFALAVAPIPDKAFNAQGSSAVLRLVDKRKPCISQGMLVLDILSTLVPPPSGEKDVNEPCLQMLWLESSDGWAARLVHMTITMSLLDAQQQPERHPVTHEPLPNSNSISQRAISMIRRLLEAANKAQPESSKNRRDSVGARIFGSMPLKDMTFSAMMTPRFDGEVMRGLNALCEMVA